MHPGGIQVVPVGRQTPGEAGAQDASAMRMQSRQVGELQRVHATTALDGSLGGQHPGGHGKRESHAQRAQPRHAGSGHCWLPGTAVAGEGGSQVCSCRSEYRK